MRLDEELRAKIHYTNLKQYTKDNSVYSKLLTP